MRTDCVPIREHDINLHLLIGYFDAGIQLRVNSIIP